MMKAEGEGRPACRRPSTVPMILFILPTLVRDPGSGPAAIQVMHTLRAPLSRSAGNTARHYI